MIRVVIVFLAAWLPLGCGSAREAGMVPSKESVVLLHGLGRTHRSMRSMERALAREGYRVVNIGYPSRTKGAEDLVRFIAAELESAGLSGDGRVNFVTHSAGGILARAVLAEHPGFPVGRVVMLAPPSRGSELAAKLERYALARGIMGPLLTDLAESPNSVPASLPPPPYPVGVIAGDRKALYLLPWLVSGPNDGIVAVEETKAEGMSDFLIVRRGHSFIMNSREVQRQTLRFLRTGRFEHEEALGG
jgi:pimeloyl-ACP methyl ester carboxylesterase